MERAGEEEGGKGRDRELFRGRERRLIERIGVGGEGEIEGKARTEYGMREKMKVRKE